jgi:hypothetical protein
VLLQARAPLEPSGVVCAMYRQSPETPETADRMRRAARVDTTAAALRAYAESLGFLVVPINGVIDCLLQFGSQTVVVDWKSKGGTLTPDQIKLVAKGLQMRFIHKPEQLDALKAEITR